MSRTGGRNSWIAVPAGLLCAAAVVTLAWLAAPMAPVAFAWVTETLRAVTSPPAAAPSGAARPPLLETVQSDADLDCRRLYPDDLWGELVWHPKTLLAQELSPPATAVTTLVEALAPHVRVTCRWTFANGTTISTTIARVAEDAQAVAEATLRAEGFGCSVAGGALDCERTKGGVREDHAFAGDLWLSTVSSGVLPEGYVDRLEAALWDAG